MRLRLVLRGLVVSRMSVLLRRLTVVLRLFLGWADSRAERIQALGRAELKRRALAVPRSLRSESALMLWRRSTPTLLLWWWLRSRLAVGRSAGRSLVVRLRRLRRLAPRGSGWRAVSAALLLRRWASGCAGRLLNRRSARKTELVGGLVLSSTASADDHFRETPGRKRAPADGGGKPAQHTRLLALWNKNPPENAAPGGV
jgi:hypothetical protein